MILHSFIGKPFSLPVCYLLGINVFMLLYCTILCLLAIEIIITSIGVLYVLTFCFEFTVLYKIKSTNMTSIL